MITLDDWVEYKTHVKEKNQRIHAEQMQIIDAYIESSKRKNMVGLWR